MYLVVVFSLLVSAKLEMGRQHLNGNTNTQVGVALECMDTNAGLYSFQHLVCLNSHKGALSNSLNVHNLPCFLHLLCSIYYSKTNGTAALVIFLSLILTRNT